MSAGGDSFLSIAEEEPLVPGPASERSIYNQSIWGELKNARQVLQEAKWDRTNKGLVGGVACCSCCSLFSLILAFSLFFLIGFVVHAGINANAVVDSTDSTGYSLWKTNINNAAPPEYECYNFFNLTNWEEIAHNRNATPEYQELGPYCYLMNHEKINVTWLDDGNQVNFRLFQNFSWAPEVSKGDAMNDMVINISPGYVGILATTGSEFDLSVAFTGPAFHVNLEWLTTIFVHHLQAEKTAHYLTNLQGTLSAPNITQPKQQNMTYFYETWANATTLPSPDWAGMLVSFRGTPSNISMDTTESLWDKKTPYSLVSSDDEAISLWFNATLPLTGGANTALPHLPPLQVREAAQAQLQEIFNLTATQVEMLCDWLRNDFYVEVLDPALVQSKNSSAQPINTVSDLGWLQWSQCGAQVGSSKNWFHLGKDGLRDKGAYLEYGCFPYIGRKYPLSVEQSKQLLNGTEGIFDMNNMGKFFASWFNATNPLHCPEGSNTHLNIGCHQCENCTQPACKANRAGYTCTLQAGQCVNQYNNTDHCKIDDSTRDPCQQPIPDDLRCLSCRNCSEFHPTEHDLLSTSNCTDCNECAHNDTDFACGECECQECDVFISCNNTAAWEVLYDTWGLEYEKTFYFVLYILYSEVEFGDPYLRQILSMPSSGLFPYRSVNDWIFNATDPLMFLANPEHPHANNLIQNMTSMAAADMYHNVTTWTGKNNLTQANTYYSYNGNTTIHPPFYPQEVPIEGTTEWGQFQPFLNERDVKDLYSFDPNYLRTIHLVRTGSVKYRDVPLWRFMVSNDTLEPNPAYYQEINGFANSTSFHQMCPIFYSNPHFALANDTYAFRVKGVAENRNWKTDYTVVDVEPNTGMVMHVNMTLQANLFLKDDYRNIRKYYQVPTGVFYPLIIAYKETTLSKDNKALYELTVSFTAWLQLMSFASFFALTFICIVCVLALLIKLVRRNQDVIPLPEDSWQDEDQIIQ